MTFSSFMLPSTSMFSSISWEVAQGSQVPSNWWRTTWTHYEIFAETEISYSSHISSSLRNMAYSKPPLRLQSLLLRVSWNQCQETIPEDVSLQAWLAHETTVRGTGTTPREQFDHIHLRLGCNFDSGVWQGHKRVIFFLHLKIERKGRVRPDNA